MPNFRKHHQGHYLRDQLQRASEQQGLDLEQLAYKPLGEVTGPYYEDCKAKLGELILLEPESNMYVDLQTIEKIDIGRLVTVRYNSNATHSVIIRPGGTDTIESGGSITLSAQEEVILTVLPDSNWGLFRFNTASAASAAPENGFTDITQSDPPTFDNSTRTLSIAPALSFYTITSEGVDVVITGSKSCVLTDTEGLWFCYFDSTGTIQATQTWNDNLISDYALVGVVYWDATNNERVTFTDERHGTNMPWSVHAYLHHSFGCQYDSGLGLGNMSVDGTGNDAANARLSVANGDIHDEDIEHSITNGSPQTLSTVAEIPILWREGASGDWRKEAATTYCVTTGASTLAEWNEYTGGTWGKTEHVSNKYGLMHLVALPDIDEPIVYIMGQATYNSKADARTGATTEMSNLALGTMDTLVAEWVPLATIIFQTKSSYSNAVQTRVVSTDDGDDFIDWRITGITPGGGSSGDTSPLTTKGDIWGYDTDNARVPVGTDTHVLKADSSDAQGVSYSLVKDSELSVINTTTNNVTSSAHGFCPKSNGVTTQTLVGGATPYWDEAKAWSGHEEDNPSRDPYGNWSFEFDSSLGLVADTGCGAGAPATGDEAYGVLDDCAYIKAAGHGSSSIDNWHTYAHCFRQNNWLNMSNNGGLICKCEMTGYGGGPYMVGIYYRDYAGSNNIVYCGYYVDSSDNKYLILRERQSGTWQSPVLQSNLNCVGGAVTLVIKKTSSTNFDFYIGQGFNYGSFIHCQEAGSADNITVSGWTGFYYGIFAWNGMTGETGGPSIVGRYHWARQDSF